MLLPPMAASGVAILFAGGGFQPFGSGFDYVMVGPRLTAPYRPGW
jgi:hypothetical protein